MQTHMLSAGLAVVLLVFVSCSSAVGTPIGDAPHDGGGDGDGNGDGDVDADVDADGDFEGGVDGDVDGDMDGDGDGGECSEVDVRTESGTHELVIGESVQLIASCHIGEDRIDVTSSVTWFSSDPEIVEVSTSPGSEGVVTGRALGVVLISAEYNNPDGSLSRSNELELTVEHAPLESIAITPDIPVTLGCIGDDQPYEASCVREDGTSFDCTTEVTWQSSNALVATISNLPGTQGLATAVGSGEAEITAVEPSSGVFGTVTLVVDDPMLVDLWIEPAAPVDLQVGRDQPFTAIGRDLCVGSYDMTVAVTWASSDFRVATISNAVGTAGVATGCAPGTSEITATLGLVSAAATLTVVR